MKTRVIVTFQLEGFHQYPPGQEPPAESAYLAYLHRHLFHWRVEVSVKDSNREVEFHQLRNRALRLAELQQSHARTWSCEQKALGLLKDLEEINYSVEAVECWEDGECGARVEQS